MSVLVKPSSLIPKGLRVQQINNLTLFKFTDELGDRMQTLLEFQCEYCHYPELLSDALTLFLHWRKSCYIMGCGSSLLGMIRSGGINRSNVFLCKGFILYNPPPLHNTNRRA